MKKSVDQMVSHGLQPMNCVVPSEREHTQRSVRLVTLLLQRQNTRKNIIKKIKLGYILKRKTTTSKREQKYTATKNKLFMYSSVFRSFFG